LDLPYKSKRRPRQEQDKSKTRARQKQNKNPENPGQCMPDQVEEIIRGAFYFDSLAAGLIANLVKIQDCLLF